MAVIRNLSKSTLKTLLSILEKPLDSSGILAKLNSSKGDIPRYFGGLFAWNDFEALGKLKQPWWSFKAQSKIEDILKGGDKHVFEYGSGNSTAWLAERAATVTSVEHDSGFYNMLKSQLPDNVTLINALPRKLAIGETSMFSSKQIRHEGFDFKDYVHSIRQTGRKFDLIVIDGRARPQCLEEAMKHLTPNGTIFLDDVVKKRPHYSEAINRLEDVKVTHVNGLRPASLNAVNAVFIQPSKTKDAVLAVAPIVGGVETAPNYGWRDMVLESRNNIDALRDYHNVKKL